MVPVTILLIVLVGCGLLIWFLSKSKPVEPQRKAENGFLVSPEEILTSRNVDFIHAAVKAYTKSQRPEATDLMLRLLDYTWQGQPMDDIRMIGAMELECYDEVYFRDLNHLMECLAKLRKELSRVSPQCLYHSDLAIARSRLLPALKTMTDQLIQKDYATLGEVETAIQTIDHAIEDHSLNEATRAIQPGVDSEYSILSTAQTHLQKIVDQFLAYGAAQDNEVTQATNRKFTVRL